MAAPCGKSNQSPQTIAVFKKLSNQPANKICFDCPAKNCTWASIPFGVFICMNCAGFHRSLGTHVSFCRSTQLDDWTPQQLAKMMHGGNARARKFFKERGGLLSVDSSMMQQKYYSDVASMYKNQLDRDSKKGYEGMMTPPASPKHGAVAGIDSTADDFFNDFEISDKPLKRSGSDGSLPTAKPKPDTSITRSASTGSVNAAAAAQQQSQNMQSIEDLAKVGMEESMAEDWGDSPEPVASPKTVKVIAAKSRPSAIGKKVGAKKPATAKAKPKAVAVKVGASPEASAAPKKASKADDWGDMDGFDDAKWESIKATAAKAEADANKPRVLEFPAAPSHSDRDMGAAEKKATDSWEEPKEDEPSIVVVDKNWNKGKKDRAAQAAKKAAAEAREEDTLRQQYAGAKSISSDQVYGTDDSEPKNYDQFASARSLGSDQYFGRSSGGGGDDDDDLDGLVNNLAEETRRDLRVVGAVLKDKGRQAAAMAGQFITNLSDRYA